MEKQKAHRMISQMTEPGFEAQAQAYINFLAAL